MATIVLLALVSLTPVMAQAEVLDRIVAVIDTTSIITLSDIRRERAIQTALGSMPGSDDEVLNSLIERHLINEQLAQFREIEVTEAEVNERLRAVTPPQGVSSAELRQAVIGELQRFEFLVQRFRQFIRVSDDEARQYYEKVLVPELRRMGRPVPPVEEGIELVRPNVIAEKMNQEVNTWLAELRRRSNVEKITQ